MKERHRVRAAVLVATSLLVTVFAASATTHSSRAAAGDSCTTANALSGSNFEIDVDANLKVDGASPCIDWLADGTGTGLRAGVLAKNDVPSGPGDDAFGQGTSEDDANPTIVDGSIPPNKSDLKVFGVFTETTASSDQFLELFWSRVQNPSGTTNMDFELNQKFCNPAATPTNCADNGSGVTPETPVRTVGDKLISYDLSKGGTVPTISIRTWGGSAWGSPTVISGGSNPEALGSVNTSSISAADSDGVGPLDPFTFGEASISFAALFPPGTCGSFGSAYLKSRSSDSFTAEIKDFVAPERVRIANCPTVLTTSATVSTTVGSPISDTATLSGAASDAGGTITFHLFSDAACLNEVATGLSPVTVSGNGSYNSGNFTPSAAGTYYWTASYSGDTFNTAASTMCGDVGESSIVTKKQPSLSTSATGNVTVGDSISDTATLSGATANAGGTITFHLFSDASCSTEVTTGLSPVTVNGNGGYNSGNFTPSAAGTYYWTASYSGDANNLAASTSCGDAGESTVVNKKQPSLATSATGTVAFGGSISDTATLSSATPNAGGTITFHLFSDASCSTEVSTGLSPVAVTGNGSYNSGGFTPTAAGTYYWTASYSGDANNLAASTSCGDAGESSVVNKKQPSLVTAATVSVTIGSPISDTATLSSATASAGGTITFHLFSDAFCSTEVSTGLSPVTVSGNGSYSSGAFTPTAAGTYYWTASYSGDSNNTGASTSCGDTGESTIVKAQPSISTKLSASPIGIGQSVTDSATLSGASSDAGGTVTYSVFSNSSCSGTPVANGGTKTVANGVVPDSDSVTFNSAGIFYWQAIYSGDAHNTSAISSCTSEQLTVIGACVLGYPSGTPPAPSSVVFNESGVLRKSAAVPGGGSVAGPNDKIALWYNDEHAMTLGVRRVIVKTATGTTTTDYPVTALSTNPGSATNPSVGTTAPTGEQAGTDLALYNATYGFDINRLPWSGRPMWPALFITDITNNLNDRSGDWQQGGTLALPPSDIFGTWKAAVRTVDKTHTPAAITVTPDTDPVKNNWNLGAGSDTPPGGFASLANEGYGAEARWSVSDLGLSTGHAYRLEFMVHDGDQNKTGGDSGEACMNVVIPG
jgi:hypothetical protein